jgi:hypothetical protein
LNWFHGVFSVFHRTVGTVSGRFSGSEGGDRPPEGYFHKESLDASLVTRGPIAKTPYFPETVSCLALILGESGDSGLGLGLDARAKDGRYSGIPERFMGEMWGR